MACEKHLLSISSAASQMLGILRKLWSKFSDHSLECFHGSFLPVSEYVQQCGALMPIHALKLPASVVSGASFLTDDVLGCNIAYRRSVAVLCTLYQIMCNSTDLL